MVFGYTIFCLYLSYFQLDFHKNWHLFLTEKVLTTQKVFLCKVNGFDMEHFMVKKNYFCNLPAALLNIAPKANILKISLLLRHSIGYA